MLQMIVSWFWDATGFAWWIWVAFWGKLDAMPETLKGAILGAFVATVGVWATNRANQNNLRAQLEHDKDTRAKEHALGLRKEIYLDVSVTLAEGLRAIIALNDLSKTSLEIIQPYSSKASSMARIHVIAKEETAVLFAEFISKIDQCFVELRLARAGIEDTHAALLYCQQQRDDHAKSRNQLFELFQQEQMNGPIPDHRLKILKDAFERERKTEDDYEERRSGYAAKLLPLHHAYTQRCYEEHDSVVAAALPLIAAVRSELDLPIDQDKYANVLRPSGAYAHNLKRLFGLDKTPSESAPPSV